MSQRLAWRYKNRDRPKGNKISSSTRKPIVIRKFRVEFNGKKRR